MSNLPVIVFGTVQDICNADKNIYGGVAGMKV